MPTIKSRSPWVWLTAIAIAALCLRIYQLSQRTFYWDDLVIPARFRDTGFTDFFQSYDGHVMPGAIGIQVLADAIAPLNFVFPACVIVVMTAATYGFFAAALTRLFPQQESRDLRGLYTLTFVALTFSPFLMTASGWWSAALNSLGWQLGFAVTLWCASIAVNSPHRLVWPSVVASIAVLGALTLSEKSLSIVPLVAFTVWITHRRINWLFWLGPLALSIAWAFVVFSNTTVFRSDSPQNLMDFLPETLGKAVIPGMLGGPWVWERWTPSQAFASPPTWLLILAVVVAAVLVIGWVFRRPRRGAELVVSLAFFMVLMWVLGNARTGPGAADLLTRTLHYYAEWWTLSVLILAAGTYRWPSSRRHLPHLRFILAILLAVSSTITTVSWVNAWKDDPTGNYLANLQRSLDQAQELILDQPVPLEVLTPLMHPYNTIYSVTGKEKENLTTRPQVIDTQGNVVPAAVLPAARTEQGDAEQCGIRVQSGRWKIVKIDNPLPFGLWVWELNAVASTPGTTMTITTPNGLETAEQTRSRAVTVPVSTDLQPEWVSVHGGGGTIMVEVHGPDSNAHICLGAGNIAPMVPQG